MTPADPNRNYAALFLWGNLLFLIANLGVLVQQNRRAAASQQQLSDFLAWQREAVALELALKTALPIPALQELALKTALPTLQEPAETEKAVSKRGRGFEKMNTGAGNGFFFVSRSQAPGATAKKGEAESPLYFKKKKRADAEPAALPEETPEALKEKEQKKNETAKPEGGGDEDDQEEHDEEDNE